MNDKHHSEPMVTDTVYADNPAVDNGCKQAQFFVGTHNILTDVYDMKTDS